MGRGRSAGHFPPFPSRPILSGRGPDPVLRTQSTMPLDLLTRLDPLRRVRCPFCFERFAACEMHLRCDDPYCKTDFARMVDDPILSAALNGRQRTGAAGSVLRSAWWVDPRQDTRRGLRRHLDWMVLPRALDCPNCGRPTDFRL